MDRNGTPWPKPTPVAVYDPDTIRRLLNGWPRESEGCMKRILRRWKYAGLFLETGPFILLFWALYYAGQLMFYHEIFHQICCSFRQEEDDFREEGDGEEGLCSPSAPLDENGENLFFHCDQKIHEFHAVVKEKEAVILRILTFLLGFYVSQIMKRYWDQIHNIPKIDSLCLMLNGLVWSKKKKDLADTQEEVEKEDAFKKLVARYTLLSWAMAFTTMSTQMQERFPSGREYIDKGLMTEEELELLEDPADYVEDFNDNWRLPLAWAANQINAEFQAEHLVPKDHKDLVAALVRFQEGLSKAWHYVHQPLPSLQGKAVTFAVMMSFFIDTVSAQNLTVEYDSVLWVLFFNFPLISSVKYILILAWIRVAKYLQDPFGTDIGYDKDLVGDLDMEIWKSSKMINATIPTGKTKKRNSDIEIFSKL